MTPEQREILGTDYSDRIERLLSRLEDLAGQTAIFDRDVHATPVFGKAKATYHANEAAPRLSLPIGTPERTVAHELLHGILLCEHYPHAISSEQSQPYVTAIATEVSHCVVHTVIDSRLHALGYDVVSFRATNAELNLAGLSNVRKGVNDVRGEHWWSIRIACEEAYHSASPSIPASTAARFTAESQSLFPQCVGLVNRFKPIVAEMDVDDPKHVQWCLWTMLGAIELEYGTYPHCRHVQKLSLIGPAFMTSEQLGEQASRSILLESFTTHNREKGTTGTMVLVVDGHSGQSRCMINCGDDSSYRATRTGLDVWLKRPLRELCDHYRIRYVEQSD